MVLLQHDQVAEAGEHEAPDGERERRGQDRRGLGPLVAEYHRHQEGCEVHGDGERDAEQRELPGQREVTPLQPRGLRPDLRRRVRPEAARHRGGDEAHRLR